MAHKNRFDYDEHIAWCPGCGNFAIRKALMAALENLDLKPHGVALVSGIGQGAKMPHYIKCNGFNGLHGRALPVGTALRAVRDDLTVLVESGDGDTYGEGGNHFLHNIRRNPDIAHFVHNNQVYGLTKGQASPTSERGMKAALQGDGVHMDPVAPLSLALEAGATFVARGFSGQGDELIKLMEAAIRHKGYALVDILQPCVTFNRINTFQWYKDRVKPLENHDTDDFKKAKEIAAVWGETIPTGIIYQVEKDTFHTHHPAINRDKAFAGGGGQGGWIREMEKYLP